MNIAKVIDIKIDEDQSIIHILGAKLRDRDEN